MRPLATMLLLRCTAALVPRALPRVSTRLLSTQTDGVTGCVEIKFTARSSGIAACTRPTGCFPRR